MARRFEEIEHTADLAIRAYGRDLAELFQNAAHGMFSLLADTEGLTTDQVRTIEAVADDREGLLVGWLGKLLLLYEMELLVFVDFRVEAISEQSLRARVCGTQLEAGDERLTGAIKAATYHGLEVMQTDEGFCAEVVFDT